MTAAEVAGAIRGNRYGFADEYDLQDGIAQALEAAEMPFEREVRVAGGRLDFLVGRIAVEVKITAPAGKVQRQIERYLEGGDVDGVVVVSMSPKARNIERLVAGKPVEIIVLAAGGL